MKKVVLLAGAVAAGMAIAPQAANAAAPNITADPYDGSSLSDEEIISVKSRAEALAVELETFKNSEWYAKATSSDAATYKTTLTNIISHLLRTAVEAESVSDSEGDNSYYFDEKNDGYSRNGFFNNGEWHSGVQAPTIYPGQTGQKWIDDYAAYGTGLTNANSIVDLVNLQEAKSIEFRNKIIVEAIKADDSYKHLDALYKVAQGIYEGSDANYSDATTYDKLKNETFKVAFKEGAYASAGNLLNVINDVLSANTVVVNPEQLLAQVVSLYPTLETQICEFKKQANTEAYKKIAEYVDGYMHVKGGTDDPIANGEITKIKNDIQHHLDTNAKCFNKIGHKIASATDVTTEEAALSTLLGGYEPDTDWNGYIHTFTGTDRALNDPKAVKMWKEIQDNKSETTWESKTDAVDIQLTKIRTAIYQTCLGWDKADIEEAIKELNEGADYLGHSTNFKGGSVTVIAEESKTGSAKPVSVESELKQWLKDFLTKYPGADNADTKDPSIPYIEGSVADMYWDRFHDGSSTEGTVAKYMKGNASVVTPTQFGDAEDAVNVLANTIANVKANWTDIVTLDNDLVARRLEMEAAAEKKGYDSDYIAGLWGTKTPGTDVRDITIATEGEWGHHESLRKSIKKAINDIKDTAASLTTKAGEWVGKDSFDTDIALENAHHDWLAKYQLENYQAKEDMLAAIAVRAAEYKAVKEFKLEKTHSTEDDVKTLADGTKLYTTVTNQNVPLYNIKGEDDTSKFIYRDMKFTEIDKHFAIDPEDATTPGGNSTDKHGDDLMYDRITKWYEDGDAQYIVEKTFQAGWVTSKPWESDATGRLGELINNTVTGLQLTKDATLNPTGILTCKATDTEDGNKVVFGWLQKEIQEAFQKAVENEKANKDLHDQIDACEAYVKAAQDDIDDNAVLVLNRAADEFDVYDIYSRTSSKHNEAAISKTHDIKYTGTDTEGNYAPVALPESYKAEGMNVLVNAATPNYVADFTCGHSVALLGWTNINVEINKLWNKEKEEYDNVASKALLDAKTIENKIDELEENVDDIKNEAFTQVVKNGFAEVQKAITAARNWARTLDNICDIEDTPCSEEDVKNNPCGWDDPTAKTALQNLINTFNTQLAALTSSHNNEQADKEEEVEGATVHTTLAGYETELNNMLAGLMTWQKAFAAADMKHKKALNDALDQEVEEAHTLHHYAEDANHAAASFTEADKKAADLWAQDFNLRENDTSLDKEGNTVLVSGEKITFQAFMERLLTAVGHGTTHPNPDKLANAERVAAAGIKNFQDYIEAMDCIEELLNTYAKNLYDHHLYTDLKNLSQGLENFNWKSDYMEAINANNAAKVELLNQLAQAQATLDAAKNDVIADKNEVYPVDYDALTTTALTNDEKTGAQDILDAQKEAIEKAWKDGKAADYSADGTEDLEVKGYALDITKDGKNVIDAYVAKAQAAKDLYAANKVAKEELLVQIQAILTNTNSAYEEVECAETAGCTQDFRTDLDNLKKDLVGEDGNGGIKKEVNDGFAAKFAAKTAAELKADVDALETTLGQVKKGIADFNHKVLASADAKADILDKIEKAFGTEGSLMKPALAETGAENFKHVPAVGEVRNTAKYFDEINAEIDDLKTTITNDDSHAGNHSALEKYNTYLQTLNGIKADLEELVQAIKDNEQAHKDQLKHRDELYKKYECYDTTGLEAAVKFIKDPDFSLDTEFPEVPGYPETAVDPAGKDHTKAHTAVAEAIKALDAEIEKHYENGASNVEAAKTKIGEKETAYTTAFEHAQANDSKFMEEYGKCTEAAKAVGNPAPLNWEADHFENGANKYSDEANVQVTNAYEEMVAAQKAYLADIKTDWYKNEAVEKVADNEGLLNTYKEKITAYKAAVEKAQTNDQEFDKQYAAHVVKPLTAEATYTDTRVTDDPTYVTLKGQLTALYPECNNVETDSKYNTIRKQIIQDWEDEKSALNGTAEAVAAYQAAAKKYNELMANLNAYGSQLVKYFEQKDAFDAAKTTIAGYDIMKPNYKDFDGNTEGAQDYKHKKDIEDAISTINGKLETLYDDMKTEANHVAETINDADLTNNEVNDLNVAPAVGTLKTLIENLAKDAKKYEDACDANEAAFEPLHDNIKTVEADYAEGSAKVTALPEPAQEAFNLAVKKDLQDLADLQKALEEAYMAETAAAFTKDNTDYEDLKKEIEDMYARAEEAGANLGDIDGVDGITVYDSDALVDIVLYNRGYAVKGDFDFNGENDVTDVERLNNLLWYKHIEKAWAPGRVAFEGDIELTAEGNTVALALNNNVKANGIQFDITVPEGAYIQNVLGTDRVEGMRVLTACIADNTYRVLVISTLNASTINGNEGAIVTFNVAGGSEVEVSNVIATDGNSHRLNGAAVSVGTVTGIDEIASEGETDIFTLDGIRQSVMKAGVNIVRGANGVAKKIFNK